MRRGSMGGSKNSSLFFFSMCPALESVSRPKLLAYFIPVHLLSSRTGPTLLEEKIMAKQTNILIKWLRDAHAMEASAESNLNNVDRKSTRLNSSHVRISYAVFCLKKK